MGRKPTISREQILDAAERVVVANGAAKLTIDAVAEEAGVSKGGVLYSFANKDALIDALFQRVLAAFDAASAKVVETLGDSPESRIRGHIVANLESQAGQERLVGLIVNFMRSPQYRAEANAYYQELLSKLDTSTPRGKRMRLALLAAEGAFMLQAFDFHVMDEREWRDIHEDIVKCLLD